MIFYSLSLSVYSGGSRGRFGSVRGSSRGAARPTRGAALSVEVHRVELHFLLRPEGGEQEPGSATGTDRSSQHGPRRGKNIHDPPTHLMTAVCYQIMKIHVLYCVRRWCHTYWICQRKMRKRRRGLRLTHMTVCGGRQVLHTWAHVFEYCSYLTVHSYWVVNRISKSLFYNTLPPPSGEKCAHRQDHKKIYGCFKCFAVCGWIFCTSLNM